MIVQKRLLTLMFLILASSCVTEKGEVSVKLPGVKTYKDSQIYNATVTNIQIINNQIVITGNNLNIVTNIKTENASKSFVKDFVIESKSNSQIIANSTSPISFAANELFKLVISNSYGAASFDISFNLCNSTLNGRALDCTVTAQDKDVLSYDAATQTWKPRAVNGLNYLGSFDASPGTAPTAQPSGSYYIISVAGTISGINFEVGDWIVSNGSAYQKIDNSTAITSVFGRTGAVVALEGDYSLDKLLDVDLTVAPVAGKILKYDGTKWVAGDDLSGGGAGSVSSTEITDGAVATVDLANLAVTDAKINDVAAGKITGTLTGTQIGAGVITNSHVAAGAAIDYSKLNIPNTTIPYAKLNIAAGEIPQDRINGLTSSLSALIEDVINDAMTTKAPSQNAVYDALSLKADRTNVTQTVTALAVTGLGAPVANSDATNKQYVDNAVSTVTTTANDKVSKAGDTMSGALVLPSNGLNVGSNELAIVSGRTGIGTATPIAKLHVDGAAFIGNGNTTFTNASNFIFGSSNSITNSGGGNASSMTIIGSSNSLTTSNMNFSYNSSIVGSSNTLNNAGSSHVFGWNNNLTGAVSLVVGTGNTSSAVQANIIGSSITNNISNSLMIGQSNTAKITLLGSNGNLGVGTTTPQSKLDVAGSVRLGDDVTACSGTNAGAMKFVTNTVYYCNGSAWTAFGNSGAAVTSTEITNGTIVDADINAAANIAQSKISGLTTDLSNKQPLDTGLTNLSSFNTNGILVQTADNTFVGRAIAGTANRITVTNPIGAAGDPTINVDTNLLPSPTVTGQFLKSTGANTSAWSALTSGEVTTALGFTPVNKSGDTISAGTIAFNAVGALSIGYTPTNLTDATSKSYVDSQVSSAANQWTQATSNIYRNSGNVGIGTAAPLTKLHVMGDNSTAPLIIQRASGTDATFGSHVMVRKTRGTIGAETAVVSGDEIGTLWFTAYDGSAFQSSSRIVGFVDGTPGASDMPGRIEFQTTPDGSNVAATRMTIKSDGNVGIGTTTPTGKLEVIGTSLFKASSTNTSGAIVQKMNEAYGLTNTGSNYFPIGTALSIDALDTGVDNGAALINFNNRNSLGYTSAFMGAVAGDANNAGSELVFGRRNGSGLIYSESMRINKNGNVGIGTNAPTTKLDVKSTYSFGSAQNGAIRIEKYNDATTAGWIDNIIGLGMFDSSQYDGSGFRKPNATTSSGTVFGNGNISFYTNSGLTVNTLYTPTERMRIDNSGNVGVGTTSPVAKLDVRGATDPVAIRLTEESGTDSIWEFRSYNTGLGVSDNQFSIWGGLEGASQTDRLVISKDGNVGIGTINPTAILDITNTGGETIVLRDSDNLVTDVAYASYIRAKDSAGTNTWYVGDGSSGAGGLWLLNYQANPIHFAINGSTRMSVDAEGDVGIGVTSTAQRFEVQKSFIGLQNVGAAFIGGTDSGYTNTGLYIVQKDNTGLASANTQIINAVVNNDSKFVVTGLGNVGIGNINPGYKLDVNGTIRGFGITDSSDIRLKKEIKPLENDLEKIKKLNGVSYFWKNSEEHGDKKQIGLIAQLVEKIYPELVETDKDGMKSVNYSHLVAPIIESIKTLAQKVESLFESDRKQNREIASLKSENQAIKSELKEVRNTNKALQSDNETMKSYLCAKDPKAPFCKK